MKYASILASALLFGAIVPAQAQDWPAREVHVICAYAAGTGADIFVRYFSDELGKRAGKQFIVENKPGALATIGAEAVKNARPDGYTLFITAGTGFTSAPYLFKTLRYDLVKDFAPVTTLGRMAFVVAVPATSPIKSVAELTALLKAKDGKGFHGSTNPFAIASSELYATIAGFKVEQVPYKSNPQALMDMLAGQLDFLVLDGPFGLQQKDKLRFLAVTPGVRSQVIAEVPTMIEAGVPGYDLTSWWGAWFPANTPQPIIDKTAGWLNEIMATDTTIAFLAKSATDPWPGSPQSLAALVPKEIEKWTSVLRIANVERQ
jgi:tripartite-type tricarboxylate transporter receptor subunit TctC